MNFQEFCLNESKKMNEMMSDPGLEKLFHTVADELEEVFVIVTPERLKQAYQKVMSNPEFKKLEYNQDVSQHFTDFLEEELAKEIYQAEEDHKQYKLDIQNDQDQEQDYTADQDNLKTPDHTKGALDPKRNIDDDDDEEMSWHDGEWQDECQDKFRDIVFQFYEYHGSHEETADGNTGGTSAKHVHLPAYKQTAKFDPTKVSKN